jgi:hypothetical protein
LPMNILLQFQKMKSQKKLRDIKVFSIYMI